MTNILLCDDSPFILSIFERRLVSKGFTVVGKAVNGDECIKLYRELRPDIVLLDITMPNKSGSDTLQELLSIDPKANVIIISAVRDQGVAAACLKAGAKDFISKASLSLDDEFSARVLEAINKIAMHLDTEHSVKR